MPLDFAFFHVPTLPTMQRGSTGGNLSDYMQIPLEHLKDL